jgi:hypothetical protein
MPGKQPRAGEIPLNRQQSVIAAEILRKHFHPEINTQMALDVKNMLLKMVNDTFQEKGYPPTYSLRKMEDWRVNCVYRWKCSSRRRSRSAGARTAGSAAGKRARAARQATRSRQE